MKIVFATTPKLSLTNKVAILNTLMRQRIYWRDRRGKLRWKFILSKQDAIKCLKFKKTKISK